MIGSADYFDSTYSRALCESLWVVLPA